MTATPACTATFSRVDGTMSAAFERRFDHPAAEVWRALTDPALLPQWLAPGEIELRLGGKVKLDFKDSGIAIDSTVTSFVEGRLLEYAWGGSGDPPRPVRWILEPDGDGCRLTLRITVPADEDVGRSAAGWEAHLEMLAATLEGVSIHFPFELFKAARDTYRARLAAADFAPQA
ncbi:SRPBCC family protein [Phenylobacterium kunshanense]|nr:SRPBCC family protein [Phenylobacterium kunshanense]